MDEAVEKQIRSLKLKLLMAEKELQASSGKWKLGVLLKAGHADAMNREVSKVKERLEAKIEKIKTDIAKLAGEVSETVAAKPAAKPAPTKEPAAKKAEPKSAAKAPAKKTPVKKK